MRYSQLPASALPAWTKLHYVTLYDVDIRDFGVEKGYGFAATRPLSSTDTPDMSTLLNVPSDLILCANFIEKHAKTDQHFRELLNVAGNKSLRGDVMLFLLLQLTIVSPDCPDGIGVSNPWTEYIRSLPSNVPVPTTWNEDQLLYLLGTSLELAVSAKLSALLHEFEELRHLTSGISWCSKAWWDKDVLSLSDWQMLDAWFRSRCLELPRAGASMVPCLDMANHASQANSYYDQSKNGDVVLILKPDITLHTGDEVNISYGSSKSAAEMLFSYGFVVEPSSADSLLLNLSPSLDDPLGKAKVAAYSGTPRLHISRTSESIVWESDFAFFMCLNEEDGLCFRILQEVDGTQGELKVFWQDKDVTGATDKFSELIEVHPLHEVFKLRAVVLLQQRLQEQLERFYHSEILFPQLSAISSETVRQEDNSPAMILRRREGKLMEDAYVHLDEEKLVLMDSPAVLGYLGSAQEGEGAPGSENRLDGDEDFS